MKIVLIILLLMGNTIHGQNCIVRGIVTDRDGNGVAFAPICVKDTNITAVTDIDGKYRIEVPSCSRSKLVFSSVGMTTKEERVKNRTTIDVELNDVTDLNEEIMSYYNQSIILEGASNYAHYGLGWYFYRHDLWNQWLHLLSNISYSGEASFHTDFKNNREIHVNIEEIEWRKYFFSLRFNL